MRNLTVGVIGTSTPTKKIENLHFQGVKKLGFGPDWRVVPYFGG